jgi:uncharacterized protein YqjF (DUF2071 family)
VPVEHQPWSLVHGNVDHVDETLLAWAGLPRPSAAPLTHLSDGVDARFGWPRPVGRKDP